MSYPTGDLSNQMAQMSMQPIQRAGDTPMTAMFGQGNVIGLTSPLTRQNVKIVGMDVQALGGNEPEAKFIVHVRRPGVVALQSARQNLDWLAIYEGRVIGNGRGGPFCEFAIGDYGNFITLDSTQYPGQRVSFYSNGQLMPFTEAPPPVPNQPNTPSCLTPVVHEYAAETRNPEMSSAPPPPANYSPGGTFLPPAGTYQQGSYPPPQGGPPQGYPPPQGTPPQQGYPAPQGVPPQGYPAPQGVPQGYPAPQGPQGVPPPQGIPQGVPPPAVLPSGFSVLDAFRTGNVVALISKSSGKHLNVTKGDVHATGRFKNNESLFTITVAANNGVILQNVHWPGLHVSVGKKKTTVVSKKEKTTMLKASFLPDNYVYFESIEYPGNFLAFDANGAPRNPKEVGPNDPDAQFFVRVEKQKHIATPPTVPYGRPSIYTYLRDESIIQLYVKGTDRYLAIDKNGNPTTLSAPNDQHTFFLWKDRGMGIVSLVSYKYPDGFLMRMGGFVVSAKGDQDLNSDFRVHETVAGGLKFESVTCPGGFLAIDVNRSAVQEMFVQMITIQKFGRSETVTKTPIN